MDRSDEQMKDRDARLAEIERAFRQAGFSHGLAQRDPGLSYSSIRVCRGSTGDADNPTTHQALVTIADDRTCSVYVSPEYELPPGKRWYEVEITNIPRTGNPIHPSAPDSAAEVVRRVQGALSSD